MSQRIVFFDFETAGLQDTHPDIQLAAVATEGLVEVDAFEAKIVFDDSLADPVALEINHYDAAVWRREAKPEATVVEEFGRFLDKHATVEKVSKRTGNAYQVASLAGHNIANFDIARLAALFKRHDKFLAADIYRPLDTLQLALWRAAATGVSESSYKLSDICERLGIETGGAHDALADTRMCVEMARVLQRGWG